MQQHSTTYYKFDNKTFETLILHPLTFIIINLLLSGDNADQPYGCMLAAVV